MIPVRLDAISKTVTISIAASTQMRYIFLTFMSMPPLRKGHLCYEMPHVYC